MKKRILIVEDNVDMAEVLADNLLAEGFEVQVADDGHRALTKAREFFPDLVILDIMLPGRDGFEICRFLRQQGSTAILMLTAKGEKDDRIKGFRLGADDYVTKPFDLDELLARIQSVLRRVRPQLDRISLGSVTVDFRLLEAWDGRRPLDLSHFEFQLLRYLAERQGTVVYRDELLHAVWRYPLTPYTRSVDQAIARLRKKIEKDPHHPRFIHTVHGEGYSLGPAQPVPRKGHK